jgi:hypothetical protein
MEIRSTAICIAETTGFSVRMGNAVGGPQNSMIDYIGQMTEFSILRQNAVRGSQNSLPCQSLLAGVTLERIPTDQIGIFPFQSSPEIHL